MPVKKKGIHTKTTKLRKIILVLSLSLIAMHGTAYAFTLGIFGNANMDDSINNKDIIYVQGIINGTIRPTELADANHDGKIDQRDLIQIEKIVNKSEMTLTYIDIFGEAETVNKPIKRLANLGSSSIQVARMLNAIDILLPVMGANKSSQPTFYPEFSKWQNVGGLPPNIDYEYILKLKPDAVQPGLDGSFALAGEYPAMKRELKEKLPGMPLICLNLREPDNLSENVRVYGYILDKEEEADKFVDWHESLLTDFINRTKDLPKNERPRVLFLRGGSKPYECAASGSRYGQALNMAGGYNIVDEIVDPDNPEYGTITVNADPEWVIKQNPEIILVASYGLSPCGYETDDPAAMIEKRQEIMNRPELANIEAVKKGRVYVLDINLIGGAGPECIIGTAYMGKIFHAVLFKDIDPDTIHQEYIDKFCHIDFDVRKHGVFIYPLQDD